MIEPHNPTDKPTDDLDLYSRDAVIIQPGYDGRYAFSHAHAGKVYLRKLSINNKRFGSRMVPAEDYDRNFAVARSATKREIDRAALLERIHLADAPLGLADHPQLSRTQRADLRYLRKQDLIAIRDDSDGVYATTPKHDSMFDKAKPQEEPTT